MSTAEQMQAITDRIIADALAGLRAEADEHETAARLYEVCDDAVAAARDARERLDLLRQLEERTR